MYSVRQGTRAANFENQVLPEIKEKRSKILLDFSNEVQKEINESYVGKKVKVLVEERQGDVYKGHTANYIQVIMKSQEDIRNKIIEIEFSCD